MAEGAEVIVPACGVLNLLLRLNKVTRIDDVPVLDGTAVALKLAEALADLWAGGLSVSRRTRYARPPAAALETVRVLYGEAVRSSAKPTV